MGISYDNWPNLYSCFSSASALCHFLCFFLRSNTFSRAQRTEKTSKSFADYYYIFFFAGKRRPLILSLKIMFCSFISPLMLRCSMRSRIESHEIVMRCKKARIQDSYTIYNLYSFYVRGFSHRPTIVETNGNSKSWRPPSFGIWLRYPLWYSFLRPSDHFERTRHAFE